MLHKMQKIILFIPFINFVLMFVWMFVYFDAKRYSEIHPMYISSALFVRLFKKMYIMWLGVAIFFALPMIILFNLGIINNDMVVLKLILAYPLGIGMGLYILFDEKKLLKIAKSQN